MLFEKHDHIWWVAEETKCDNYYNQFLALKNAIFAIHFYPEKSDFCPLFALKNFSLKTFSRWVSLISLIDKLQSEHMKYSIFSGRKPRFLWRSLFSLLKLCSMLADITTPIGEKQWLQQICCSLMWILQLHYTTRVSRIEKSGVNFFLDSCTNTVCNLRRIAKRKFLSFLSILEIVWILH